jgi:hypothetical protein
MDMMDVVRYRESNGHSSHKRTKNTGGLDYQENVQEMNQTVNITPPPFVEPHRLNTRIEEEDIDKEKDGGPTG